MNRDEDTIYAEALRWHAACESDAIADGAMAHDAMDWDGFTAWLEADPRHRDAYDAVALGVVALDEHRDTLWREEQLAANDDEPVRRRWMPWAGAAIAASLVAMLGLPQLTSSPAQVYRTQATGRTIALDDGSSVSLAPHSSLAVSGRHQESLALTGGAWFDIRHDPTRAMTITAGGVEIGDIGTRFDVQEAAGQVRVEVAEGVVQVRSAGLGQPIRLTQGRALSYDSKAATAVVRSLRPEEIGEWRSGRLTFASTPLPLVAADLSRYAGVTVAVAQGLRDREFSGTLVIGDGEASVRDLSQLMGVELRHGPAGLVLDERR